MLLSAILNTTTVELQLKHICYLGCNTVNLREPTVLEEYITSVFRGEEYARHERNGSRRCIPLKCWAVCEVHSITTQKIILFIAAVSGFVVGMEEP
jgi:hypothetical protein